MSEPTAEQVNAEREEAHVVLRAIFNNEDGPWQCALKDRAHDEDCDVIATALARVRIEAHAAGRDEGLREADDELNGRILGTGCSGDVPMRLARDAIRALRART